MRTAIIIALLSLSSFSAIADDMVTLPSGEIIHEEYAKRIFDQPKVQDAPVEDSRTCLPTDEVIELKTLSKEEAEKSATALTYTARLYGDDDIVYLCSDMTAFQLDLFKKLVNDEITVEQAEALEAKNEHN